MQFGLSLKNGMKILFFSVLLLFALCCCKSQPDAQDEATPQVDSIYNGTPDQS